MIMNGASLLVATPIKNMLPGKVRLHGVSHGLGEAGYDIRIKQAIDFRVPDTMPARVTVDGIHVGQRFCIASAIEEFQMPDYLVGIVHDKSTWARRGLSVFNTVIEPGWRGFLTLELVYHGSEPLFIPAGAGIAQVIFHRLVEHVSYEGKYQNQADKPVGAING
jgi:dCTP deaminase